MKKKAILILILLGLFSLIGLAYYDVTHIGWDLSWTCPADDNIYCIYDGSYNNTLSVTFINTGEGDLLSLRIELEGCKELVRDVPLAPGERWDVKIKYKIDCIENFNPQKGQAVYASYTIQNQTVMVTRKLIGRI